MSMDSNDALRLTVARRSLEDEGLSMAAKVSYAALLGAVNPLLATIKAQDQRIAQLEKQVGGMQKSLDHHEEHALTFRGEWQEASAYPPGCVVRHRGGVYTALRSIIPGKAEPSRQGSGWDRII